jgi:hypothetical protein
MIYQASRYTLSSVPGRVPDMIKRGGIKTTHQNVRSDEADEAAHETHKDTDNFRR